MDAGGGGDKLDFTLADTRFNMLGNNDDSALPADQKIANVDVITIFNLGIAGADAYAGDNTSVISAPRYHAQHTERNHHQGR